MVAETPPAAEGNHRPNAERGTMRSDWWVAGPGRRGRGWKGLIRLVV